MEVKARTRYLRMAPRKVRLVIDAVRGKTVVQARVQLQFMNKAAAEPVLKLINSAVANATNNFGLSEDGLRVKSVVADGGPILYRYRPAAMGRATPIRKRTTHITLVLESAPVKDGTIASAKEKGVKKTPAKKAKSAKSRKKTS